MDSDEIAGKPASITQACMRLRFRHMQFLDILGKTRNLRLTAEQMHMTQPAATKVLMDIEDLLQARLFDRLPRGMRPNEMGLFTLRYASAALTGHRKFVAEFSDLKQGGHGHVTIGAISGSAAHLLTASIAEMQRLRPLLTLKVFEQSSDQLITWLAEGKIDLMIGRFTDEARRSQFQYERLSGESLLVVGGLHHSLRGAQDLSIDTLAHWPWVLYPPSTALRRVTDDFFASRGLALSAGIVETPSFLFALEFLQSTEMLSMQPAALVEKYVKKGLLSKIAVDFPDRMPDYGLITRLSEPPAPAAQAFMDVIRSIAASDASID